MSADKPISQKIRQELKTPVGLIIPDSEVTKQKIAPFVAAAALTVAVGDRTTDRFQEFGFSPSLEIVDSLEKRVRRQVPRVIDRDRRVILSALNPPGYISHDSLEKISVALKLILLLKEVVRLEISGEEDLLALPVIAFFPQRTATFYGQPNVGMVVVTSDDSRKRSRTVLGLMGIDALPEV